MSQMHSEQRSNDPSGNQMVEVTERQHSFSPGRVIGIGLGLLLAILGTVTLLKTGVGQNLTTPQVTILGMTQSAAIGLIELGAGLLLALFGAWEDSRPFMAVLGVLGVFAGVVGVASPELQHNIGFTSNTAWFIATCGVVAIVAAALPVVFESRRNIHRSGPTHTT